MVELEREESLGGQHSVVVFSKDDKLLNAIKHALSEHTFSAGTSYEVVQSSDVVGSYQAAATVFDLDLVAGDLDEADALVEQVLPSRAGHPLFIVGGKSTINELPSVPRLNTRASRTFAKPVIGSQVMLALNLVKDQAQADSAETSEGSRINKPLVLTTVGAVLLIASAIFIWANIDKSDSEPHVEVTQIPTAEDSRSEGRTKRSVTRSLSDHSDQVRDLLKQAEHAIAQNQIITPTEKSALNYYRQILDIDRFGEHAGRRKEKVIADIKLQFLVAQGERNLPKAEEILQLLREVAPFNAELASLEASLRTLQENARNVQEVDLDSTGETAPTPPVSDLQEPNIAVKVAETPARPDAVSSNTAPTRKDRNTTQTATIKQQEQPPTVANSKDVIPTTPTSVASQPVLIKRVEAVYPKRALKLDIQGWVGLRYQVDQDGKPVNIEVVKEVPKNIFTKNAVAALEQWRYEPRPGKTVASDGSDSLTTKFNFSIDP